MTDPNFYKPKNEEKGNKTFRGKFHVPLPPRKIDKDDQLNVTEKKYRFFNNLQEIAKKLYKLNFVNKLQPIRFNRKQHISFDTALNSTRSPLEKRKWVFQTESGERSLSRGGSKYFFYNIQASRQNISTQEDSSV